MKALITLVQPAFDWTWRNSVQAAVLIGLVLLVQKVLGRWLTPRLRYALSLLILLRLLLPAVPSSPLSLQNLFPPPTRLGAHSQVPGEMDMDASARRLLPLESGRLSETSLPDGTISSVVTESAPVSPTTPFQLSPLSSPPL